MCDCSFGSHLNYSINLAVSRSSNSLRKPDREFGSVSEELRRQKVPPTPGESRSPRVHQHLHDDLSVILGPRYEFMIHAVQIYERGDRHEDNRKLVKVKAKKPHRSRPGRRSALDPDLETFYIPLRP